MVGRANMTIGAAVDRIISALSAFNENDRKAVLLAVCTHLKVKDEGNDLKVIMDEIKGLASVKAELRFAGQEINEFSQDVRNCLDSLSEFSETESLRLQMAMDRMSKFMATLSNIEKKISDTENSVIQNLK